jgi:penicillin-binding protein 2
MKPFNKNRHELKDAVHESRLFFNRALIAFLVVFLVFSGLIYRAYILQVVNHKDFATKSDRNRITLVAEAPVRGIIYDRNGVILADNRSVFSLELIPEKVKNMDATLESLQKLFSISTDTINDFKSQLKLANLRGFKNLVLLSKVSEKQRAIFEVNRHLYPGAIIQARLVRYYPFGKDMVHMLGYVGRINDRELLNLDQNNYKVTRHIGKVGLEKYYEPILHGQVGFREVEMDVHGRVIRVLKRTPPVPGKSLKLSIDSRLQLVASKQMGKNRGAVVAINPQNGAVLALVSNPGYDPNAFVTGIGVDAYKKLLKSKDRPLFNRALRGQYPPGSTIKPMLGLAGLEYGLIDKNFKIKDPGWYQLENEERIYRDHNWRIDGRGGHGEVDIIKAIKLSCDTYFYRLAYNMGIDRIHESNRNF